MKRKPRPSADARTLSMFTGKTDLESPDSRDGSKPTNDPAPRASCRLIWRGAFDRWWTERKVGGRIEDEFIVERRGDRYHASFRGRPLGDFDTAEIASAACEAAR